MTEPKLEYKSSFKYILITGCAVLFISLSYYIYLNSTNRHSMKDKSISVHQFNGGSTSFSNHVYDHSSDRRTDIRKRSDLVLESLRVRYKSLRKVDISCTGQSCKLTGDLSQQNGTIDDISRRDLLSDGIGRILAENNFRPDGDIEVIVGGGGNVEMSQNVVAF